MIRRTPRLRVRLLALASLSLIPSFALGQGNEVPEITPVPNPGQPPATPGAPTAPIPPVPPPGTFPVQPQPQPQPPAQPQPPEVPQQQPQQPAVPRPEQQLDRMFLLAQNAYKGERFADAGGLLFKAAAAAESAADPTQEDLAEAVATLRVLAFDTASQAVADPTRFDRAFAATHHALARQAFLTSTGAWAERRTRTASESLAAASYHLGRSIEWGGRSPSPAGRETLALADQVAVEIAYNATAPVAAVRVKDAYQQLGAMIPATGDTLAKDRENAGGTDDRIEDAAERAIEGIRTGTRKAAEKVGEKISDFGQFLQGQ